MIEIVRYRDQHFDGVASLWEEAFPGDPPRNRAENAVPKKLAFQPELFLVAVEGEQVIGTVLAGYDGHRGWLYSLAVRQSHRRSGIGTRLVRAAEERLALLGCEKVNLQVRASNSTVADFYRSLGYDVEERISMGRVIGP